MITATMLELSSDPLLRDQLDYQQPHLTTSFSKSVPVKTSTPMSKTPLLTADGNSLCSQRTALNEPRGDRTLFFDTVQHHRMSANAFTPSNDSTFIDSRTPELIHEFDTEHNTPVQTPKTPQSPPIPGPKPETYRLARQLPILPLIDSSKDHTSTPPTSSPTNTRSRTSSIWSVGQEVVTGLQPFGMRRDGVVQRKETLPGTLSRRSTLFGQSKAESSKTRPESLFKILNEPQPLLRPIFSESNILDTSPAVTPSCILRSSTPFTSSSFRAYTPDGSPAWFCRFDNLVVFSGMVTEEKTGEQRPMTRSSKGLPAANRNGETVMVCVEVDCDHCRAVLGIVKSTRTWKYEAKVSERGVCTVCRALCQKEWARMSLSDASSSSHHIESPAKLAASHPIGLGISPDPDFR